MHKMIPMDVNTEINVIPAIDVEVNDQFNCEMHGKILRNKEEQTQLRFWYKLPYIS